MLALSFICFGQTEPPSAPTPSLPQSPTAAPLSVDEAVAEALQSNPEIRASVRRLSLAQLKNTTARSLDDPMLMVRDWQTPLRKPWDLNQAQLMFSVQQTFLEQGEAGPARQGRRRRCGRRLRRPRTTRQEVSAEVREACAALLRNADEMRLHNQQAALLNEALSAALAEYTTGKVPQADVLRAQMALTRLNEHLIELEEERDTARAQLNSLMGRSPDEASRDRRQLRSPAACPPIDELERVAIEHRPELAALRKQIVKSGDEGKLRAWP